MISTIVDGWKVRTFLENDVFQTEIYGTENGKHTVLQYRGKTIPDSMQVNVVNERKIAGQMHLVACRSIRKLIGFE